MTVREIHCWLSASEGFAKCFFPVFSLCIAGWTLGGIRLKRRL